jgi:hypothetical protein
MMDTNVLISDVRRVRNIRLEKEREKDVCGREGGGGKERKRRVFE